MIQTQVTAVLAVHVTQRLNYGLMISMISMKIEVLVMKSSMTLMMPRPQQALEITSLPMKMKARLYISF